MSDIEEPSATKSPYENLIWAATSLIEFASNSDNTYDYTGFSDTVVEVIQAFKESLATAPTSPEVSGLMEGLESAESGIVEDMEQARSSIALMGVIGDDALAAKHRWDLSGRLELTEALASALLDAAPLHKDQKFAEAFDTEFSSMQARLKTQFNAAVADGTITLKPALILE